MSTTQTTATATATETANIAGLQKFLKIDRVKEILKITAINGLTNMINKDKRSTFIKEYERCQLIAEVDKNYKSDEFINLCSIHGVKFSGKKEFITSVYCNIDVSTYYNYVTFGEIPVSFYLTYLEQQDKEKLNGNSPKYGLTYLNTAYKEILLSEEDKQAAKDKKEQSAKERKNTQTKATRVKDGVSTEIGINIDGSINGSPENLLLFLNDAANALLKSQPEMLDAWIKGISKELKKLQPKKEPKKQPKKVA